MDWLSAVPGDDPGWIRVELSLTGMEGPWTLVADSFPNGGRLQWWVPQVNAGACYLRLTLFAGGDSVQALTNGPFRILSPVEAGERPPESVYRPRLLSWEPVPGGLQVRVLTPFPLFVRLYTPSGRKVAEHWLPGSPLPQEALLSAPRPFGVYLLSVGGFAEKVWLGP